jgi:hypothetical protein
MVRAGNDGPHVGRWDEYTMSRVQLACAVAAGLALSACSSSWMPNLDLGFKSSGRTQTLQIESEPPGAEARTSQGQACRTPCALAVAVAPTSISFSLNGYQPQTVAVSVKQPEVQRDTEFAAFDAGPELTPNPVAVEMEAAPAPPPPARRRSSPPPRQPRPTAQQTAPAATQAPASPFPPPPAFPQR